jgi:hypothetical protein
MTFKTKFRIGREIMHNGFVHSIDSVQITVSARSKEILYRLVSIYGRILATEAELIVQNVVEGC